MKMIVNQCYGGFSIKDEVMERLGLDKHTGGLRYNTQLIAEIERLGSAAVSGPYSCLEVVELPNNATDHYIENYDGIETVLYVVDGKIHTI